MTVNKIYNGFAFTENEREKANSNRLAYKELCEKYKILKTSDNGHIEPSVEQLNENDIVYSRKACYGRGEYIVYKKPQDISTNEMLLILDEGILCFGGIEEWGNHYSISED